MADKNQSNELVRPSGQTFSIDTGLAAAYGIKEAFIIHHFQHWIRLNKTRNKNFRDEKTWTYQTYNEIADHFPFLTFKMVRTAIENLIEYGVIIKSNYNQMPGDNTCWFAFSDESIYLPEFNTRKVKDDITPEVPKQNKDLTPLPKRADPCPNGQTPAQTGRALPDTKPDTKPYDKTTNPTLPELVGLVGGSQEKVIFFQCLQKVDIQEKDKVRLTEAFSESIVANAVAHCIKPEFKAKSSLDRSIFYFCKNPEHISKTKKEIEIDKIKSEDEKREIEGYFKAIATQVIRTLGTKTRELGVILRENLSEGYFEIYNDRIKEKIYYSNKRFSILLAHILRKVGLEVPSFLGAT